MKYAIIFLFSFLFLLFTSSVSAEYARYEANPVVKPVDLFDKNGASSPSLLYENGVYKMWYNSFDGVDYTISYATSSDGVTFSKYTNNPVIRPQKSNTYICERWVHDPYVLWNSDKSLYQMWFTGACDPPPSGLARWWIKYAESIDGINWNIREQPVLYPSLDRNVWDVEGVTSSSVVYKNGSYQMWFAGRSNGGAWRIGYAVSSDGISWTKYANNPVLGPTELWDKTHTAGSEVSWDGSQYIMVYYGANIWPPLTVNIAYSNDGILWTKPSSENPLVTTNETERYVGLPSLLQDSSGRKVYYSAEYNNAWNISLISDHYIPVPTPTLSVSPTPTNTPSPTITPTETLTLTLTPTPTPTIKQPVIIIPGLFASWNRDAILHNSSVSDSAWTLNPIVHEYDGIMKSLENAGYEKNKDYFLFAYDWRRSVESIADSLNTYIKSMSLLNEKNVKIVGHSLGGLIGRIYTNKYGDGIVSKLVTLGSPHQGVPQVYPALSAGEIERDNSLMWLAEKSVLVFNRSGIETDKEVITRIFPVLYDLLPTYDYLRYENGLYVNENIMSLRNRTLNTYEDSFSGLFPIFTSIYGISLNTHWGYTVKERSALHVILDNYVDGEPIGKINEDGDGTVNSASALADEDAVSYGLDHGDLVVQKEPIKKVFTLLGIPFADRDILTGEKTNVSPSLIFFMRSPASLSVKYNGIRYEEQEGIVFIPNAENGEYTIEAQGKEKGSYSIVIGQITETDDWWDTVKGSITSDDPSLEKDEYSFTYPDKNAFLSPTPTFTPTPTATPTFTLTPTKSPTPTKKPTLTPIKTKTPTPTISKPPNYKPPYPLFFLIKLIQTIIKRWF